MKVAGPVAAVMTADWAEHRFKLVQLRTAAFVDEQGVPPEIEMDSEDAGCHHLLALLGEEAVGAARLLADGRWPYWPVSRTKAPSGLWYRCSLTAR